MHQLHLTKLINIYEVAAKCQNALLKFGKVVFDVFFLRAPSSSFVVSSLVAHVVHVRIALASFLPPVACVIDSSVLWYKGSIS